MAAHKKFIKLGGIGFYYCVGCGLVNLKNWISALCMRLGCDYDEHPEYKAWLKNPGAYPK